MAPSMLLLILLFNASGSISSPIATISAPRADVDIVMPERMPATSSLQEEVSQNEGSASQCPNIIDLFRAAVAEFLFVDKLFDNRETLLLIEEHEELHDVGVHEAASRLTTSKKKAVRHMSALRNAVKAKADQARQIEDILKASSLAQQQNAATFVGTASLYNNTMHLLCSWGPSTDVSQTELEKIVKGVKDPGGVADVQYGAMMDYAVGDDDENDGHIELNHVKKVLVSAIQEQESMAQKDRYAEVFAAFDTDGDKSISSDEMWNTAKKFGISQLCPTAKKSDVETMMNKVDWDRLILANKFRNGF